MRRASAAGAGRAGMYMEGGRGEWKPGRRAARPTGLAAWLLAPAGLVGERAGTGPAIIWRAGPCRPAGLKCGPSTACTPVPCQPGPNELRAVPCLGRAKVTGFGPC